MEQLRWIKSRHSNPSGNCVEVAPLADGGTAMRNSRHPDGAVLRFTAAEMAAFAAGVKGGEFDFLTA
jgi:hypothetical protein